MMTSCTCSPQVSKMTILTYYNLLKDEILITVGCPIFASTCILIAKYLFTGSLKNRSIDNLETQKKYISMKNSQFFNYLLYANSKWTWNKILIKKSLSTKLPTEERRTVSKMNGTAITNRLQNSFKIKDNNLYRSSYYWNFRTSSFKQVACLILKL